jgi:hypothetical protein
MLVSAHDGAVDHGVFVVGVGRQKLEHTAPHAAAGPSAEARMDRLPIAEALRQVTPGNACSIAVDHGIDEQTIVLGGHPDVTLTSGQDVPDPVPLVIANGVATHQSAPRQPPPGIRFHTPWVVRTSKKAAATSTTQDRFKIHNVSIPLLRLLLP